MFDVSDYYGIDGVFLARAKLVRDKYGLDTGECVFNCPTDKVLDFVNASLDAHPLISHLDRERQEIQLIPGISLITCGYAGITVGETEPVYELTIGESQEPIETHPDFEDFAGTPSAPLNGAIFLNEQGEVSTEDETGIFSGFRSSSDFAGISAYMDASQVRWRKTWVSKTRPNDISQLSNIDTPEGPKPSLGGGRNWRYVGLTYQQRGKCYFITKEWQASAAGGWNSTLY